MKQVTRAYKQAMNKIIRDHSYMIVTVGVVSNEAQASAEVTSTNHYLSDNKTLFKNDDIENTYATFEQNVFKADGSMIFPPENTGYQQLESHIACLSAGIKGAVTVSFDKPYDIKGLTINFGEYYPRKFKISLNDDEQRVFEYTNSQPEFTCEDSFDATYSITITPSTFVNGNNKRLRIESMLMGIGIVFQNDDIETASITDSASFISEELPQIDFNITCFDRNKRFLVDDNNSFINYLEAGQEIVASVGMELEDGSIEWVDLPLTYLSSWSSNTNKVAFTSVDRFAFLTSKYTLGNRIYTRTLYDEAISVLTDAGLLPDEYEISDILRTVTITNPMPEVSHAEALQLIANAGRCSLKQNSEGAIQLLPNFENIIEPDDITIAGENYAEWSVIDGIKTGADTFYADFSNDYFIADGSLLFMPTDMSQIGNTGFVSADVSNDNGLFTGDKPKVTFTLPAAYTYYGVSIEFHNPMRQFTIKTYEDGVLIDTLPVTAEDSEQTIFDISHSFYSFDVMEIEFDATSIPNQRVILKSFAFGKVTEYELTRSLMLDNPIGTVEPKTQSVGVKVFTFTEGQGGNQPQAIDDNVFSVFNINPTGEAVTFENQLISDQAHALEVAKWIANYYANNITYEVSFRGEPRIESMDYIFLESEVINNLQVEVESCSLEFNGALKGSLELRRALNLVSG